MASIANQANRCSTGLLWQPHARAARAIPLRFLVTIALVVVAIVALLCLAAALFGYRDGYSQGYSAGADAQRELQGRKT